MPEPDSETPNKKCGCCCFPKNKPDIEAQSAETLLSDTTLLSNKVALTTDLPKELKVGSTICIPGVVQPNCSRFAVNLTCGRGPSADIAFHFNPRLCQHYVVRNCRLNGRWGDEETISAVKFSLAPLKTFVLHIFVSEGEFLVSLDGVHICAFKFRTPLAKVTGLEVLGRVDVQGVEHKELTIYPEPVAERKTFTAIVGRRGTEEDGLLETAMDTPVTVLLPGGFQRDWQLEIYGRVKILPHSFYVNLQEGAHHWPHPIIPLHLNPRFSTAFGEHLFVRNAWIDGGWGQEERAPGFQFSPGSPFTMAIRRGDDHFSVWVDGKLAGEFKFRGAADKVDTVHVQGDVVLYGVYVDENPSKTLM